MKTIKAVFRPRSKRITAEESLVQWDYGQVLRIEGLELPTTFEVDFSLDPNKGVSDPGIGTDNEVRIPDILIEAGDPIYAFVVLHQEADDGETEYRITIPVEKRPARGTKEPDPVEQSIIAQTLAALNQGVNQAREAEASAIAARDAILGMSVEVEMLEPNEPGWASTSIDEETGDITMTFGVPYGEKGDPGEQGVAGAPGRDGRDGVDGAVFTPHVSRSGILSWTNNGQAENPESINIVSLVLDSLQAAEEGSF